jgi:hypothetical protein
MQHVEIISHFDIIYQNKFIDHGYGGVGQFLRYLGIVISSYNTTTIINQRMIKGLLRTRQELKS